MSNLAALNEHEVEFEARQEYIETTGKSEKNFVVAIRGILRRYSITI